MGKFDQYSSIAVIIKCVCWFCKEISRSQKHFSNSKVNISMCEQLISCLSTSNFSQWSNIPSSCHTIICVRTCQRLTPKRASEFFIDRLQYTQKSKFKFSKSCLYFMRIMEIMEQLLLLLLLSNRTQEAKGADWNINLYSLWTPQSCS